MTKYWLVVINLKNFNESRGRNFTVEGFQDLYEKKVKNVIEHGHLFVYYIARHQRFGAIFKSIDSYYYDAKTDIGKGTFKDPNESFPHRFKIRPIMVPVNNELLDAGRIIENLPSARNKKSWGYYVHKSLRDIPKEDFEIIKSEMKKSGCYKEVNP